MQATVQAIKFACLTCKQNDRPASLNNPRMLRAPVNSRGKSPFLKQTIELKRDKSVNKVEQLYKKRKKSEAGAKPMDPPKI